MNSEDKVLPEFKKKVFNCPFCNVHAFMSWENMAPYRSAKTYTIDGKLTYLIGVSNLYIAQCSYCKKYSIWIEKNLKNYEMLYPKYISSFSHYKNIPESIKKDFEEAKEIFKISPKASCALLRLIIEKIANEIEPKNREVKSLKEKLKKLSVNNRNIERILNKIEINKILENESGNYIKDDDTKEIATALLELISYIVEVELAQEQRFEETFKKFESLGISIKN